MRLVWTKRKRDRDQGRRVALPVIQRRSETERRGLARWRAATLIAVWVLAIAHVVHWSITGRSMGRVVLSDAMKTLEVGELNPGFVLFVVAGAVTLLAGRFLCGWACHMGALQDLCAWVLRRVGVRPHIFRSRLLALIPFVLAGYMFVWPSLKRDVVAPAARQVAPQFAAALGPAPAFPGFWPKLTTTRMWEGLPSGWVAVPFLVLSGCATVYFLGARGLCRYACPYAGIFNTLEPIAPGRVVVDPARCDQCGRCTAACTTGVRVHEQIAEHGFVADPDCIRSLDCIASCPQDALSIGARSPITAVRARFRNRANRRYDMSLGEEAAVALAAGTVFFATRGLYGMVPMLLAATLGVLSGYVVWKTWRLVRDDNVRLGRWQLRRRGKMTRAGRVASALIVLLGMFMVQSIGVRVLIELGRRADDRVTVPFDAALAGHADAIARRDAERSLRFYTWSRGMGHGGIGLVETPEVGVRIAWLRIVVGDTDSTIDEMRLHVRSGRGGDTGPVELAQLLLALGRRDEALTTLESAWARDHSLVQTRDMMCSLWAQNGRAREAAELYAALLRDRPRDAFARAGLGRLHLMMGSSDRALQELSKAADDEPTDPGICRDHAWALFVNGREEEAVGVVRRGIERCPPARAELLHVGAELLSRWGRQQESGAWLQAVAVPRAVPPVITPAARGRDR